MSNSDGLTDELRAEVLAAATLALAANTRANRLLSLFSAVTASHLKILEAASRLEPGDIDTGRLLDLLQRMRLDVEEIQGVVDSALRR